MKRTYIKPVSKSIVCEDFCCLNTASVYNAYANSSAFDHFDVTEQEVSKSELSTLWGDSNKDKWGDD